MADIILEATSTELNYSAGVTGPIQSQIDSIKSDLATVETEFVASRKYKSGEYFIYGDTIYIAITEIASGSDFVIGTNVNQISSKGFLNTLMSNNTKKKWDAILQGIPVPPEDESESE